MGASARGQRRFLLTTQSRSRGKPPQEYPQMTQMGEPKALTVMAHKLARVLWHLLKFKQAFDWNAFAKEEEKMKRKKLTRLQNIAANLNLQLVPLP